MFEQDRKNIQNLLDHLDDVRQSANKLGMKLIEEGNFDLGRLLMANVCHHDVSKFLGVEWDVLVLGNRQELLSTVIEQHNRSNPHHPEYYGKIQEMDDVHVAEMVCDWKSRSSKFGTSLEEWIHSEAMQRYGFTKNDVIYGKIMKFVHMILDRPFTKVTK